MSRKILAHYLVIVCCSSLLLACGFQLRGSATLPFKTLYISVGNNSSFGNQLKRSIRTGTATEIVADPAQAEARLDILNEAREKEILSLDTAGRVREYVLRYRMTFRVTASANQRELIAANEIVLKRDISFNDSAVLAKDAEENLLYRDMQNDAIQQVLRRLAAQATPADPTTESNNHS